MTSRATYRCNASVRIPGARAALSLAALAALAGMAGGCQPHAQTVQPVAVPATMELDQATVLRDWDVSTAYYQNGEIVAGPTLWSYQPAPNQPLWRQGALDVPVFLANTVLLPVRAVQTPPTRAVTYQGLDIPPTYTAMPELPPGDVSLEQPAPEPAPEPPPAPTTQDPVPHEMPSPAPKRGPAGVTATSPAPEVLRQSETPATPGAPRDGASGTGNGNGTRTGNGARNGAAQPRPRSSATLPAARPAPTRPVRQEPNK